MSFWSRMLGREARASLENPQTPLSFPFQWLFGGPTTAGVSVNTETALQVPALWACVNVISETVASLPLHVYRVTAGGATERDLDSPLYTLLHDRANDTLSSFRWRRLFMRHLLLHGRHYSRIESTRGGKPIGIFPLNPSRVTVTRRAGKAVYTVQLQAGGKEDLGADEVLHFTGLEDDDGLDGVSPVVKLKDAIGLAIALEQFGARFFANDARPGIIIKHPGALSQPAVNNLKASIEALHGGVANAHKTMVLEEGSDIVTVQVEPEHAQFLQTRLLQLQEIARAYRVPPIFLQDLSKATFSNNEQQDLHFVKHTLTPWLKMLEQEMELKLFSRAQLRTRKIEFNVDGLLRGDFQTRMQGYAQAIQNGVMKPNEAREKENLPADPNGDKLMIQGATVPIGSQAPTAAATPAPGPTEDENE